MFVDGVARFLVFQVGNERFAVPLAEVAEVVDAPDIQPLADAPRVVLGIATVRDAFVPAYDSRPLLRVSQPAAAGGRIAGAALLFIRENKRIALAVDDVFDALSIREDEVRPPPSIGVVDGFVAGVVRRGSELIAILDCHAMLNAAIGATVEPGERKRS